MTNNTRWGSNLSFILAMIGSAVGLGNIWRYPYVLYYNGGGAFYIPYIIAILVLGLPFLILEYGVGYHYSSSFAKTMKTIHSKCEYLGWFVPIIAFMMMIYYSTILGWDGIYIILSFFKGWGRDPYAFFNHTLLHSTTSPSGLLNFVPVVGIAMLIGWGLVWSISHKDLEEGLGKVSKVLVPLLFIIMIIIVSSSILLPGANLGLHELFNPDWESLLDFGIWLGAFGQVVFSISLGMGIAFTFASYSQDNSDLVANAMTVAFANVLFENFAALGVFSILGHMSLQTGSPIEELITQGVGLVFIAYPTEFNALGTWTSVLAPLFFIAVYIAGLTSILTPIEPLSFSIQNKFGLSRRKTMTILCIVGAILSMVYATAYGEMLLDYIDTFTNQIAFVFGIIFEVIVFSWLFKAENLIETLNAHSKTIKIHHIWLFIVKYFLPILLSIIWIGGLVDHIYNQNTDFLMVIVIAGAILLLTTIILTRLPPKNPEWEESEERF